MNVIQDVCYCLMVWMCVLSEPVEGIGWSSSSRISGCRRSLKRARSALALVSQS